MDTHIKVKKESIESIYFDTMLSELTEEDYKQEIDFIGMDPFRIKTINAQQMFNLYQTFPKMFVWDMRSQEHFKNCHFKSSINIPVDRVAKEDFINFNVKEFIEKYIPKELDKEKFKKRKRSVVVIVAHRVWSVEIFKELQGLFDFENMDDMKFKYSAQDILATKNSILLYRAFKKEKTREVYICRNSFNAIQGKYPFMCKFKGHSLYMDPKKWNGYPNEIIDRRLYLGDATHAKNRTIMYNLGITHILNVSTNLPNTFEDSKSMNITYKKINLEDTEDAPLDNHLFNAAYEFIDKAISKKKIHKMKIYSTKFDLVHNFSDSRKKSMTLVNSAAETNDILLDLSVMAVSEIKNKIYDKLFDIDSLSQIQMHHSNNQNRVLVHCAMGRSRSASMVIMYLMRKFQVSFDTSFDIVKLRREIIDPNEGFIAKLKAFDREQFKLKRGYSFRAGVDEIDELEELSQASDTSDSSTEDLLEKSTVPSTDIKIRPMLL